MATRATRDSTTSFSSSDFVSQLSRQQELLDRFHKEWTDSERAACCVDDEEPLQPTETTLPHLTAHITNCLDTIRLFRTDAFQVDTCAQKRIMKELQRMQAEADNLLERVTLLPRWRGELCHLKRIIDESEVETTESFESEVAPSEPIQWKDQLDRIDEWVKNPNLPLSVLSEFLRYKEACEREIHCQTLILKYRHLQPLIELRTLCVSRDTLFEAGQADEMRKTFKTLPKHLRTQIYLNIASEAGYRGASGTTAREFGKRELFADPDRFVKSVDDIKEFSDATLELYLAHAKRRGSDD